MTERRTTILVVDDVPDDIAILEEILKKDYQVKAVTNGEDALRIARGDIPPDLILLDIMMPDMDGFEVCRNLRQDSEGAAIPVIFLTAKSMAADEKLGFELGAADYVRKPVDPEIVRARVKAQLELKDRAFRFSELRFRRLFETAKDGIIVVDAETGTIIDVNPSMAAMMGLSQESFLGARTQDLEFMKDVFSVKNLTAGPSRRAFDRDGRRALRTADGRDIFVEARCSAYQVNHREAIQFNVRDITSLVEVERERDELSARLSHYLSTSPTITYSVALEAGAARWKWISDNVSDLLGYSSREALAPDWWFGNVYAPDRAGALGIVADLSKGAIAYREYRFFKKDREVVWLRDQMRLVRDDGAAPEIVGTLTDISAQKKAEEEMLLKSAALEAAANAVIITDRDGVIHWANAAFGALTGYSNAETIGKNPRELLDSGRQGPEFFRGMWDTILAGEVWSGTLENRKKSGEIFIEEMTITPVLEGDRHVSGFIAIKTDITQRVKSRELLEATLREKSALLRELHHRVNNNMQVIISLMNVSSNDMADAVTRGKLEDITRRLHSMALIHEQFYHSDDMSRIDFALYLRQLLESLRARFPDVANNTTAIFGPGLALLNLEQAIPAGLIVSELLTNAMMHAFPEGRAPGKIGLTQRLVADDRLEIEVIDDGIGLPPGLDPTTAQSLGMMLVGLLTKQLGGTVELRGGAGTVAILRFPVIA